VGARSTWIAVIAALIAVGAVVVVVASLWAQAGDDEMSTGGWIALVLGVLVALALGMGLMALVFISSRRGYDERDGGRC
jgi:NADH:ubiquinone oxidoreductase subunit 6 (subunit J)